MSHPEQDADTVRQRPALWVTGSTLVGIVVSLAISALVLRGMRGPAPAPPVAPAREVGGVEQTLFVTDRAGLRYNAEQRRKLEGYGWVDRRAELVRIPIERAFEIMLEGAR